MDSLIARIKVRAAVPEHAIDSLYYCGQELDDGTWVTSLPQVPPPATDAELDDAEASLGFPIPPLLRRLLAEVGNGGFGPAYGLEGVESVNANRGNPGFVVLHNEFARADDPDNPAWKWPSGLVPLVGRGCNIVDCVDFHSPPYPVLRFDPDHINWNRPPLESLIPISPSLESYLEAWVATDLPKPNTP
jgi:hypothetical protein